MRQIAELNADLVCRRYVTVEQKLGLWESMFAAAYSSVGPGIVTDYGREQEVGLPASWMSSKPALRSVIPGGNVQNLSHIWFCCPCFWYFGRDQRVNVIAFFSSLPSERRSRPAHPRR